MFRIFSGNWRGFGGGNGQATLFMQIGLEFRDVLHHFKGAPLAVFMAIALHSDSDGFATPSYDLLQRETGLARDTVARAIHHLCSLKIDGQRVLLQYRERDPQTKRFYGSSRYIIFPTPEQIAKYEPLSDEVAEVSGEEGTAETIEPELDFPTLAKSNEPESDFSEVGKSNLNNNHILNKNSSSLSASDKKCAESANPTLEYLERAETLYRRLRPSHLIIPHGWHYEEALKVLNGTLEKYGGDMAAAEAYLRPFMEEADRRGISPTNLCWLAEWAAAGRVPELRSRNGRGGKRSNGNGHGRYTLNTPEEQEQIEALVEVDDHLSKFEEMSDKEKDQIMAYLNQAPFGLLRPHVGRLLGAGTAEEFREEFARIKQEVGDVRPKTAG